MAILAFQDTLAGATAGALAGRVATTGQAWANSASSIQSDDMAVYQLSTGVYSITQTVSTNNGCCALVPGWTPPANSYGFGAIVKYLGGSSVRMGPGVRIVANSGVYLQGYFWEMVVGTGYQFVKSDLSTGFSGIGTAVSHTFTAGETHYLYLYAASDGNGGVNLYGYVDGVLVATYNDPSTSSPLTATGSIGLQGDSPSSSSATGMHVLYCQTDAQAATLTGPTSGTAGVPSTNFTATLEVPAILAATVTPSDSSAGGTFTPTSPSITGATSTAAGSTAATFTYTAPSSKAGSNVSISATAATTTTTPTVSGSPITYAVANSAATSYTLTGPSGGVVGTASTNFSVTPNGLYTGTITITPSGGGLTTAISLTFNNSSTPQTFTITPTATGSVTLTPTSSPQLGTDPTALTYTVSAAPTVWTYYSTVSGFTSGLSTVGYTVKAHDGSTYAARTTTGVAEIATGSGIYGADVSLPFSGRYTIVWDDGQTPATFAPDTISPLVVETTGLNLAQATSLLLAAIANKTSADQTVFYGTDGLTQRLTGTIGSTGDRTAVTQTPPV